LTAPVDIRTIWSVGTLQTFTNREKELDVLRRVLDLAEGHALPVVIFWGVGGNGKPWLLRKLREATCQDLNRELTDRFLQDAAENLPRRAGGHGEARRRPSNDQAFGNKWSRGWGRGPGNGS
jgi:hypothetical protein